MNHFHHSLNIGANPAAVYAALTTTAGVQGWWTRDCDVAAQEGGKVRVRFGGSHKEMRIDRLEPGREVRWFCTKAHIDLDSLTRKDEWVGTQMVFRLTPNGEGQTRLDFEHVGLVHTLGCYDVCNSGWQYFLGSLQQFAETGKGSPREVGDSCDDHRLSGAESV